MARLESKYKIIPFSQERVFDKLANLDKLKEVKGGLPDVRIENNTIAFHMPVSGLIVLKVVDREPNRFIRFKTLRSPQPFELWIEILPEAGGECRMTLTMVVDTSPFMLSMIRTSLQDGLEKISGMLAMMDY